MALLRYFETVKGNFSDNLANKIQLLATNYFEVTFSDVAILRFNSMTSYFN